MFVWTFSLQIKSSVDRCIVPVGYALRRGYALFYSANIDR